MIGAFVFGEELGRGDVAEVATGVVERGLECGTPDEDERANDQTESAGKQAQAGPRMGRVHWIFWSYGRLIAGLGFLRRAGIRLRESQQMMNIGGLCRGRGWGCSGLYKGGKKL